MTEQNTRNTFQNLAAIFVIILGISISFIYFYHSNVTRITHQNENYIADIAAQRTSLISDHFRENIAYIESSAIVLETAFLNEHVDTAKLNVAQESEIDAAEIEKVGNILRTYEDRFAFDHLRYIDMYGRDYTTGKKIIAALVAEREYYKEGVRGKTGMTYILDSKVTSERQIGFFSPIYQNGEMAGIAVGFYAEAFIDNLLKVSIYDSDCDVLLCSRDGTIIYNTGEDIGADNFLEDLTAFSFSSDADVQNVKEAFENRSNTLYNYLDHGESTVGYVSYVGEDSDFFLILNFPADAYHAMIRNAGMNGAVLLVCLICLFAAATIFYIARFLIQKKRQRRHTHLSLHRGYARCRPYSL